jgi:Domain of unknown function (DUF4375)
VNDSLENLEWLPEYSGQSVDQVLALVDRYRVDSLVIALEQAVDQKSARVGEQNLSQEERIILAVDALEREVNNGGYSQFFTNSSSEYAPIIHEALERIECPEVARITRRAIEALTPSTWTPDAITQSVSAYASDERQRWARTRGLSFKRLPVDPNLPTKHDAIWIELDQCDQLYYRAAEDIAGKLFEFVKANKHAIQI